eukprot:scaffold9200_cov22-Tisochrysis_lutea.AAC.1
MAQRTRPMHPLLAIISNAPANMHSAVKVAPSRERTFSFLAASASGRGTAQQRNTEKCNDDEGDDDQCVRCGALGQDEDALDGGKPDLEVLGLCKGSAGRGRCDEEKVEASKYENALEEGKSDLEV